MTPDSDTPPDHEVIAIKIDAALLPDWFDEVTSTAAPFARRIAVLEKPDAWIVRVELPKARTGELHAFLAQAWERFADKRRAAGAWDRQTEE